MPKPTIRELMDLIPMSKSYAAVILQDGEKGAQPPPLNLAALIFCKAGWRHHTVSEISDQALTEIAEKQPWTPPKERAAA